VAFVVANLVKLTDLTRNILVEPDIRVAVTVFDAHDEIANRCYAGRGKLLKIKKSPP